MTLILDYKVIGYLLNISVINSRLTPNGFLLAILSAEPTAVNVWLIPKVRAEESGILPDIVIPNHHQRSWL